MDCRAAEYSGDSVEFHGSNLLRDGSPSEVPRLSRVVAFLAPGQGAVSQLLENRHIEPRDRLETSLRE
jgi:hypothetical protein